MSEILRLDNISQSYSGRNVLDVPGLALAPGQILGLAGPNGSGKSTLLRLIAQLEPPAAGKLQFLGRTVDEADTESRRQVTLLTQEPYLLKRTVFANVAYGLKVRGERDVRPRVREALALVGLDPNVFAPRLWFELSGGETQRVALAARLVLRPRLLLLDEPTASLDSESAALIRDAVLAARDRDATAMVIASHDMPWLNGVSDRILHMDHGRMVDNPQPLGGVS
ncbi:ABC transporter ATP-binding protein [Pseudodesulfovibrio sp.]|uniref:ABC transporter ATP-binding protein n=1 Tax=Pseudodesulfovibrio sp. TaxID=2035812 RepID=UPI002610AC46|nr:ABC transporter ATP-binding protein [Pseudodesulfovibrio sp.]MDD3310626.1 ABC transporter ATP-binding protein [Pseudodesulfovibrio sp.]